MSEEEDNVVKGRFGKKDLGETLKPHDPTKTPQSMLEALSKDPDIEGALVIFTKPGSPGKQRYEIKVSNINQQNVLIMNRYLERMADTTIFG